MRMLLKLKEVVVAKTFGAMEIIFATDCELRIRPDQEMAMSRGKERANASMIPIRIETL